MSAGMDTGSQGSTRGTPARWHTPTNMTYISIKVPLSDYHNSSLFLKLNENIT
jgi:hypothetical protein